MRILADVNIEGLMVRWLRGQDHDVLWAAELPPAIPDDLLLEHANSEGRIVLTYDRDFGELIFNRKMTSHGVVLLRLSDRLHSERLESLKRRWHSIVEKCEGYFVVVTDDGIRARPIETSS